MFRFVSFRFVFGRRCLPFRFVSCRVFFRFMRFIRFMRFVSCVFGLFQGLAFHPFRAGRLLHFLQHKQQPGRDAGLLLFVLEEVEQPASSKRMKRKALE